MPCIEQKLCSVGGFCYDLSRESFMTCRDINYDVYEYSTVQDEYSTRFYRFQGAGVILFST